MKRFSLFFCVIVLFAMSTAYPQTAGDAYLNIDYLKVDSRNYSAFEELVTSKWKPVYEKVMGPEQITGWFFYRVVYPGGQAGDYNFVLICTYKNLNAVVKANEKLKEEIAIRNDKLMEKTLGFATHQYSELWKTEAEIMNVNDTTPSPFKVMNYMMVNPGKEFEYLVLENDLARPLHEERINEGKMHSWRTYSLIQPGGIEYGYNFATADYYIKLSDIEFGFTNEIIKSVMPNTNITKMFEAIYATRDIMKSELWQLVDFK